MPQPGFDSFQVKLGRMCCLLLHASNWVFSVHYMSDKSDQSRQKSMLEMLLENGAKESCMM